MKKILVFILAISILYSSTKDAVSYASYLVNLDYIATTLCINRNDSEPLCKGKCVLKETLENNHESDGEIPLHINEEITINYFWPVKENSFLDYNLFLEELLVEEQRFFYFFSFNKDLLRPPQLRYA